MKMPLSQCENQQMTSYARMTYLVGYWGPFLGQVDDLLYLRRQLPPADDQIGHWSRLMKGYVNQQHNQIFA